MRRRQPRQVLQEALAHFEVVRSTVDRDLPVMVEAVRAAIVRSSRVQYSAAAAATLGPQNWPQNSVSVSKP